MATTEQKIRMLRVVMTNAGDQITQTRTDKIPVKEYVKEAVNCSGKYQRTCHSPNTCQRSCQSNCQRCCQLFRLVSRNRHSLDTCQRICQSKCQRYCQLFRLVSRNYHSMAKCQRSCQRYCQLFRLVSRNRHSPDTCQSKCQRSCHCQNRTAHQSYARYTRAGPQETKKNYASPALS